jgi:hypothetical protein
MSFVHTKLDLLRQFGDFDAGSSIHDTLPKVTALVNAQQLYTAFAEWIKACHKITDGAVINIDVV